MRTSPALRYPKSLWSYNPIPNGCVFYAPLWNPGLQGPVFKTPDPFGHICTRTGGVTGSQGITMDGDDLITLPDTTPLQLTGDFTVEAWVRREAIGAFHTIVSKYDTGGDERGWLLNFEDDNKVRFTVSKDGTNFTGISTVTTYTDTSAFLHIIGAYNSITDGSSVMKIDVDNVERATSSTAVSPLYNSVDPIRLGVMQINNVNSRFLVGTLGEVWIYNRFLSAEERAYSRSQTRGRYD